MVLSFILTKPFNPSANPYGMKPTGQTIPTYKEVPMTQVPPFAPDHATPVDESIDDEIPF